MWLFLLLLITLAMAFGLTWLDERYDLPFWAVLALIVVGGLIAGIFVWAVT